MGCDGGTIPKRDELVKTKKKPEQFGSTHRYLSESDIQNGPALLPIHRLVQSLQKRISTHKNRKIFQKDKASELSFRWCHCSISQQPLQKPIVACALGKLYSKITVLEGLLDRTLLPETASHLKSIKDVKELKLTVNPAYAAKAENGDGYIDRHCTEYICPTIGLEMNGRFKFCFIWTCGCVMSERALKEIKDKICHKCQQPFKEEDIVILNAVDKDLDLMVSRLESRQARIKAERRDKKLKNKSGTEVDASTSNPKEEKAHSSSNVPQSNGSKPDQVKLGDKRSSNNKELFDPAFKKAKSEYSVSKDPNATDVYKSLFTTSSKAQNQTKAHWITYNPFYN